MITDGKNAKGGWSRPRKPLKVLRGINKTEITIGVVLRPNKRLSLP